MAVKYQFDGVRFGIVEHIREDWPSDMRQWEQFEVHIHALSKPLDVGLPVLDLLIPEPAAAICLARRYDIPEILPAAFLALSSMRIAQDFDKHRTMGDDGMAQSMTPDADHIVPLDRTARWSLLDAREMRVLCRVREYLQVDFWTGITKNHCSPACEGNQRDALNSLQKLTVESGDIIPALDSKAAKPALCPTCKQKFAHQLADARQRIWPALTLLVKSA